MSYTIVGVIGHIDHGKTSLVAALTGIDTDTHPEEKRRGITIDLGFATFLQDEHRFALIDAPGHQKYIGNLLAGVSAVDIGLLVVACDQGIQAQTLEHAAILHSLGVSRLIVAMSRSDLADEATREELSEELDLFLAEYGFVDIPKIPLSSHTGEGLDALRGLLVSMARPHDRIASASFRMPVDRVFNVEGRGSVVAGTPWSGQVSIGDQVQIARTGKLARVRELEVHGEEIPCSKVGVRTAINLAGISPGDVVRGDDLVTEGTHRLSTRYVVNLTPFQDSTEIRCPTSVQIHTATSSCACRITGPRTLAAGESSIVIIDTDQPLVVTFGQACLFRKPYPVGSFAGGRVLGSVAPGPRQTTRLLELGAALKDEASAEQRLTAWVEFYGELEVDPCWMELNLDIAPEHQKQVIQSCTKNQALAIAPNGRLTSPKVVDRIRRFILKLLKHQAETTDDAWLDEQAILQRASSTGSTEVIRPVLQELIEEKKVVRVNRMIAVASEQTVLSKKQRARMDQLLSMYSDQRKPPTLKEAAAELDTPMESVASLIRFATQQRILIDLGKGFFISEKSFQQLCEELHARLTESATASVAEIRDVWGITRKHAIPLLEYCDKENITVRDGDTRSEGKAMKQILMQTNTEATE